MQIAVWLWLRENTPDFPDIRDGHKIISRVLKSVLFEQPFYTESAISCFADICVTYDINETLDGDKRPVFTRKLLLVYEVKPLIGSVGAIVRQCRALECQIESSQTLSPKRQRYTERGRLLDVRIVPVVMHDDPKLPLLAKVLDHIRVWDGSWLSSSGRDE